jgi:predicted DCC family thiol-disulfide oxidoreductase YuxK
MLEFDWECVLCIGMQRALLRQEYGKLMQATFKEL